MDWFKGVVVGFAWIEAAWVEVTCVSFIVIFLRCRSRLVMRLSWLVKTVEFRGRWGLVEVKRGRGKGLGRWEVVLGGIVVVEVDVMVAYSIESIDVIESVGEGGAWEGGALEDEARAGGDRGDGRTCWLADSDCWERFLIWHLAKHKESSSSLSLSLIVGEG